MNYKYLKSNIERAWEKNPIIKLIFRYRIINCTVTAPNFRKRYGSFGIRN
jgi:hypothetical protein